MGAVVAVGVLIQQDLLAALRHDGQRGLQHAGQRLHRPIFRYSPPNALDQLLTIGLHARCIAFRLVPARHIHPIHRYLLSLCSIAYPQDLQDHTITLKNYSTTPCPRVSIISSRQRTSSSQQEDYMADKRVWFITGAGRGMGVAFAKAALAAGNAVVATGRNTDVVARAVGQSEDLLVVQLDVTRPA